jgi:hypothetical protein
MVPFAELEVTRMHEGRVDTQAIVVRVRPGTRDRSVVELVEVEDQDGKSIRPDEIRTDKKTGEQTYHFYVERRVRKGGQQ